MFAPHCFFVAFLIGMKDGGGLSELASFVESIRGKLISFEASQLQVNRSERTINFADSNFKYQERKYFNNDILRKLHNKIRCSN